MNIHLRLKASKNPPELKWHLLKGHGIATVARDCHGALLFNDPRR